MLGKTHTEAAKNKIREKALGRPAWNKGLTKETDIRVAKYVEAATRNHADMSGTNNPMYGRKHLRELWKDPEFVRKFLRGNGAAPNRLETLFNELTPPNVRYVGDGTWWRKLPNGKHKNPDFKVTGENKVIELFGDYWHRNDDPQELIKLYAGIGISCLVLWETDIKNNTIDVLKEVTNFVNGD